MNRILLFGFLLSTAAMAADSNWPNYRGPYNTGVAGGPAPLQWSDSKNIRWKVDIPGHGNSSPVVWGDSIFLTTAVKIGEAPPPEPAEGESRRRRGGELVEHEFVVMALDRATGKTLWKKVAKVATPHEGYHSRYGSFASNSPVTDGEHVIASFGSRGVYCYDMGGNLVWEKDFGVKLRIAASFGEGTAPVLDGEVLVLNYDHEDDSFIVALDKSTGKQLWRRERDEGTSWSPPLVVEHEGRKQVIVSASGRVRGYDLKTGESLWEFGGLGSNVIPSPVYYKGVVLGMSGHRNPNLVAARLTGPGDLTDTDAVLWTNQRGNAYTPSPVLHDGKYYVLSDKGMVSCYNPVTGEAYYQQKRLPKPYNFKASPVAAGKYLYLASENEDVIVLKLGATFEVAATNTMTDQTFIATPAVSNGEMFLRGATTLFCISEK